MTQYVSRTTVYMEQIVSSAILYEVYFVKEMTANIANKDKSKKSSKK